MNLLTDKQIEKIAHIWGGILFSPSVEFTYSENQLNYWSDQIEKTGHLVEEYIARLFSTVQTESVLQNTQLCILSLIVIYGSVSFNFLSLGIPGMIIAFFALISFGYSAYMLWNCFQIVQHARHVFRRYTEFVYQITYAKRTLEIIDLSCEK